MSAKYSEIKKVHIPCSVIMDALSKPDFFENEKIKFVSSQPTGSGMVYRYKHGMSLLSHGETILITVTSTIEGATEVEVYSECALPTQIVDWGQNKSNVTNIFNCLDKYLSSTSSPSSNGTVCPYCNQSLPTGSHYCAFCGNTF